MSARDWDGWRVSHAGLMVDRFTWERNPNVRVDFIDDGEGVGVSLSYLDRPLGFSVRSDGSMAESEERVLPLLDRELDWFIGAFNDLLAELSARVNRAYREDR